VLKKISHVQPCASAGGKRSFAPLWKLGLKRKNFWKTWNQQFNSN